MIVKSTCLVLLIAASSGLQAKELLFCDKGVVDDACKSYIAGWVDGALSYANQVGYQPIVANSFETRALKFRAGSRFKVARTAHCSHSVDEAESISLAVEEQIGFNTITNLEEMKLFIDSVLKCGG